MPLTGEKKRAYQRIYMRERRLADRAFWWEAQLRQERRLLRKALRRVKIAEAWAAKNPADADPNLLSLAYHWNQITAEEEEKAKNSKRVCV